MGVPGEAPPPEAPPPLGEGVLPDPPLPPELPLLPPEPLAPELLDPPALLEPLELPEPLEPDFSPACAASCSLRESLPSRSLSSELKSFSCGEPFASSREM